MIKILLQKRMLILSLLASCILGSSPTVAKPPTFTETYDIPTTPCEGLSLDGVEYSFTIGGVPSANCEAGSLAGPGVSNNINDPSIVGDAEGVLHLTFDHPTTQFGFGVALNTFDSPQPQSVIVHLFRPGQGTLRQELFLDTTNDPNFVGGRFDYDGPAVKSVTISFSGAFDAFAIDNTTYNVPPGQTP